MRVLPFPGLQHALPRGGEVTQLSGVGGQRWEDPQRRQWLCQLPHPSLSQLPQEAHDRVGCWHRHSTHTHIINTNISTNTHTVLKTQTYTQISTNKHTQINHNKVSTHIMTWWPRLKVWLLQLTRHYAVLRFIDPGPVLAASTAVSCIFTVLHLLYLLGPDPAESWARAEMRRKAFHLKKTTHLGHWGTNCNKKGSHIVCKKHVFLTRFFH